MELLKNLLGSSPDEKSKLDYAQVNKSVVVPSNKEDTKRALYPKEDPGPRKDRFISCKKTIAKTVTGNKNRVDERGKLFNIKDADNDLKDHEGSISSLIELTNENVTQGCDKLEQNKEQCDVMKQTILYLKNKSKIIQQLEDKEKMLQFPIRIDIKEKSELVEYLKSELKKHESQFKKLQENFDNLLKAKNKTEEELAKNTIILDTKSKKIAELNYTINVSNTKIKEYQKKIFQQAKALDEIKKMNNHEQTKYIHDICLLKDENAKLIAKLKEKDLEIKKLEKEHEEFTAENALKADEQKIPTNLSKSFHKINESIHIPMEGNVTLHIILECDNV